MFQSDKIRVFAGHERKFGGGFSYFFLGVSCAFNNPTPSLTLVRLYDFNLHIVLLAIIKDRTLVLTYPYLTISFYYLIGSVIIIIEQKCYNYEHDMKRAIKNIVSLSKFIIDLIHKDGSQNRLIFWRITAKLIDFFIYL